MAKVESGTLNAGKYKNLIKIYQTTKGKDSAGFPADVDSLVISVHANVKTTKGMTLIANDADFEKAYTRFLFRTPKTVTIDYGMFVVFKGIRYSIEYINDVDEAGIETELQCKEVRLHGTV